MADSTLVISGQESEEVEVHPIGLATELDAPDDEEIVVIKDEKVVVPDDKKVEEVVVPDDKKVEEKVVVIPDPQIEILRGMRAMRRDNADLKAKLAEQEAELVRLKTATKTVKPDEDDLLGITEKPVDKEEVPLVTDHTRLQQDLAEIFQAKGQSLGLLAETMSFTPEYKDIVEVCNRDNLDDLIEVMAKDVAKDYKINQETAALLVEKSIWQLDNPYKWMYKTLKEYHPKFKTAAVVTPEEKDSKDVPIEGRKPKVVEAPASIVGKAGEDTTTSSGWTAAKLDAMDDLDLVKVPENIRQLYITGQLA